MRMPTPIGASLLCLCGVCVLAGLARADDLEGDVVYLPMPAGETLTVDNRLGTLRLRGWDEPQVRIVATKRAREAGMLDRLKVRVDLQGGKLAITAGVYFSDGWRPVPLAGAGIDLTIDAPRAMAVRASTFHGFIDAAGFQAGAHLESQQGEIRAADIRGPVDTRSLEGRQLLQGIHGPLDANGIEGDLDLESIDGETLGATVFKGQITAREVRSPVVRLRTTVGSIIFVGALMRGGHYDLDTIDGDVRLVLRPTPFRLLARAPMGKVTSGFALVKVRRTSAGTGTAGADEAAGAGQVEGAFQGGGALLELVSAKGSISLTAGR